MNEKHEMTKSVTSEIISAKLYISTLNRNDGLETTADLFYN